MSTTTTAPHSKEHLAADSFLNAVHQYLVEPWAVLSLFRPDESLGLHVTQDGVADVTSRGFHVALLAARVASNAVADLHKSLGQCPPPPYLEPFRDDVVAHVELIRRGLETIDQRNDAWVESLRAAFVSMDRLVREWDRLRSELDAEAPSGA